MAGEPTLSSASAFDSGARDAAAADDGLGPGAAWMS